MLTGITRSASLAGSGGGGSIPSRGTKGPDTVGKVTKMETSEATAELFAALAAAQGQVVNAKKNSKNSHHGNQYADITAVLDAVRLPLKDNGLAVITIPCGSSDQGIMFESRVTHKSGQWMFTRFAIPMAKRDAQGLGSAITYARRYAISSLLGVGQEDDDGNAASGVGESSQASNGNREHVSEPRRAVVKPAIVEKKKHPPGTEDAAEAIARAMTVSDLEREAKGFKPLYGDGRAYVLELYKARKEQLEQGKVA